MLVGRIFGDAWSSVSTNMQARLATGSLKLPVQSQFKDFKRGLLGGSASYAFGSNIRQHFGSQKHSEDRVPNIGYDSTSTPYSRDKQNKETSSQESASEYTSPEFSQSLSAKGLEITMQNKKQGIVSVTGEAYKVDDKKTGLTSFYPTRLEATQDGIPEDQLQRVVLDQEQFIDMSSFSKDHPNPHNFNAIQQSRKLGKDIHYAHINESSPPDKVSRFLEVSKSRNQAYGIKGVIVKRQGNQTSDQIIRMYSHKDYEKRKNI